MSRGCGTESATPKTSTPTISGDSCGILTRKTYERGKWMLCELRITRVSRKVEELKISEGEIASFIGVVKPAVKAVTTSR